MGGMRIFDAMDHFDGTPYQRVECMSLRKGDDIQVVTQRWPDRHDKLFIFGTLEEAPFRREDIGGIQFKLDVVNQSFRIALRRGYEALVEIHTAPELSLLPGVAFTGWFSLYDSQQYAFGVSRDQLMAREQARITGGH